MENSRRGLGEGEAVVAPSCDGVEEFGFIWRLFCGFLSTLHHIYADGYGVSLYSGGFLQTVPSDMAHGTTICFGMVGCIGWIWQRWMQSVFVSLRLFCVDVYWRGLWRLDISCVFMYVFIWLAWVLILFTGCGLSCFYTMLCGVAVREMEEGGWFLKMANLLR